MTTSPFHPTTVVDLASLPKTTDSPIKRVNSKRLWELAELTAVSASALSTVLGLLLGKGMLAMPSMSLCLALGLINRDRAQQVLQHQQRMQSEQIAQSQSQMVHRLEMQQVSEKWESINTETSQQLQQLSTEIADVQADIQTSELVQQQLAGIQELLRDLVSSPSSPTSPPVVGRGRVAIFIDSANLELSAKQLGIKRIEYRALLEILRAEAELAGAWFYVGVDEGNQGQQSFLACLRHLGYEIVSKPIIHRMDGSAKANVDVELALDMVAWADQYDTAVLVSGDGDFTYAVQQLQQQGKKVEVLGYSAGTSQILKAVADSYIPLETLQDQICRVAMA